MSSTTVNKIPPQFRKSYVDAHFLTFMGNHRFEYYIKNKINNHYIYYRIIKEDIEDTVNIYSEQYWIQKMNTFNNSLLPDSNCIGFIAPNNKNIASKDGIFIQTCGVLILTTKNEDVKNLPTHKTITDNVIQFLNSGSNNDTYDCIITDNDVNDNNITLNNIKINTTSLYLDTLYELYLHMPWISKHNINTVINNTVIPANTSFNITNNNMGNIYIKYDYEQKKIHLLSKDTTNEYGISLYEIKDNSESLTSITNNIFIGMFKQENNYIYIPVIIQTNTGYSLFKIKSTDFSSSSFQNDKELKTLFTNKTISITNNLFNTSLDHTITTYIHNNIIHIHTVDSQLTNQISLTQNYNIQDSNTINKLCISNNKVYIFITTTNIYPLSISNIISNLKKTDYVYIDIGFIIDTPTERKMYILTKHQTLHRHILYIMNIKTGEIEIPTITFHKNFDKILSMNKTNIKILLHDEPESKKKYIYDYNLSSTI